MAEYRKYAEIKKKRHKKLNWFKLSLTFIVLLFFFYFLFRENSVKRDQLILYRIIGNDLPPRHKEGQTLSNLQFILDHEPPFPNTRKIFLLNRISDPANEAAIVRLLDQHQMEYIRVPFDEKEYEQLDFQLESFPDSDFLHSDDYRRYSKVAKLRILDFMYHTKNLYAMNNVSIFRGTSWGERERKSKHVYFVSRMVGVIQQFSTERALKMLSGFCLLMATVT